MMQYVPGIVLFLIELRVLFNTQYYDFDVDYSGYNVHRYPNRNLRVKLWHVLLLLIGMYTTFVSLRC